MCVTVSQDPCGCDVSYFVFSLNGIPLAPRHRVGRWGMEWGLGILEAPASAPGVLPGPGHGRAPVFLIPLWDPDLLPVQALRSERGPSGGNPCRLLRDPVPSVWPHSWSCIPLPRRAGPPQAPVWPAWESLCREDPSLSDSGTIGLNRSMPGRLRLCPS